LSVFRLIFRAGTKIGMEMCVILDEVKLGFNPLLINPQNFKIKQHVSIPSRQ
jgi:hypothetical protein